MKVAVLGGTFNPVHLGHLNIAREVRRQLGYGRIVFVPANIPAHKRIETDVGTEHRLNMLELAVNQCSEYFVEDCELRRGGTSYTIDTVRELRSRYNLEGKPGLIIGDDLVEDFNTWRDVEQLVELVDLIVAHRRSPQEIEVDYPCRYIDNSLYPVSSSEIRGRIKRGESVEDCLPEGVRHYIARYGLYV